MKKRNLSILLLACALSTLAFVSALTVFSVFTVPMKISVATQGSVAITIDSQTYINNTEINWGTVNWGNTAKSVTITNNANNALTPSLVSTNLPSGWTLTLSLNQPIAAGQAASGTLTLNVPTTAQAGDYTWSSAISVSY